MAFGRTRNTTKTFRYIWKFDEVTIDTFAGETVTFRVLEDQDAAGQHRLEVEYLTDTDTDLPTTFDYRTWHTTFDAMTERTKTPERRI